MSEDVIAPQSMKFESFDEVIKCEKIEMTEFSKYEKLEIKLSL